MDIRLELDPALSEPQVVVRAPAMTPEVGDLLARLEDPETLLGFREGEAVPLQTGDILRFYGAPTPCTNGSMSWSSGSQPIALPGSPIRRS